MEKYFLEEQKSEKTEESHVTFEASSNSMSVSKPSAKHDTNCQIVAHVYIPSSHLMVRMNNWYFSSMVALELHNIYME